MWTVPPEMAGLMEPRPILGKVYCLASGCTGIKQAKQINKQKILAPFYRFLTPSPASPQLLGPGWGTTNWTPPSSVSNYS